MWFFSYCCIPLDSNVIASHTNLTFLIVYPVRNELANVVATIIKLEISFKVKSISISVIKAGISFDVF